MSGGFITTQVLECHISVSSLKKMSFNFIYLFLAVLVLHCCTDFCLVVATRGYSRVCSPWMSHCSGFSCGVWAPDGQASVVVVRGLSSCGSWALLRGIWDLPRAGIDPSALGGGFFTTEPPGKPLRK